MGIRRCQERTRKTPTESLIRSIEISEAELGDTEALTGFTVDSVTPSGELVALDVGYSGRVVELSLDDGEDGTDYIVLAHADTDGPQRLEIELLVEVRE